MSSLVVQSSSIQNTDSSEQQKTRIQDAEILNTEAADHPSNIAIRFGLEKQSELEFVAILGYN